MTLFIKRLIHISPCLFPSAKESTQKAKDICLRVENIIQQRRMFEIEDYFDINVEDLDGKAIEEIINQHSLVGKTYLVNNVLRVFPIIGKYPSPRVDLNDDNDIIVSRYGESY